MRLIDADAFKAEGRDLYREAGWDLREVHYSQMDVECNIDYMPTIETEPVKDTIYKFSKYQIEWLTSHNDITLCPEEEDLIVHFLEETAKSAVWFGMDEDNTETLEAWDLDGSPTRYIRGQREDKAQDCGTCKHRKTCKDAPIPSCYACLGYEPTEAST